MDRGAISRNLEMFLGRNREDFRHGSRLKQDDTVATDRDESDGFALVKGVHDECGRVFLGRLVLHVQD